MSKFKGSVRSMQMYRMEEILAADAVCPLGMKHNNTAGASMRPLQEFDPSGATVDMNTLLGDRAYILMDQSCTFTIQKYASRAYQEVIVFIDPATYTLTWGDTITWPGGAPTLTASTVNVFKLWTIDSWVTIYGETEHLGLSYTPSYGPVVAAYSFANTYALQFNIATETAMKLQNGMWTSSTNNTPLRYSTNAQALTHVPSGNAILCTSVAESPMTLYDFDTNVLSVVNYMVSLLVQAQGPNGGLDPDGGSYRYGILVGKNIATEQHHGAEGIDMQTFATKFLGPNTLTYEARYGAMMSIEWGLWRMGGRYETSASQDHAESISWTSGAINYQQTMTYTVGEAAASAFDFSTGIGYILGGYNTDLTSAVDDIMKCTESTHSFSTIAGLLPANTSGGQGMAQDGTYVWAYRTSNSFKFTISTETAAVFTNESDAVTNSAVVHGDTLPI